tara:strand:+ start:356 stop:862 length:507 start_codon:yes stop_codon:yes gene_type:complete
MTFEVIDNFLSDYYFKSIITPVLRADFNWNFNDHVVYEGTGDFQFIHNVFSCKGVGPNKDIEWVNNYYPLFEPVLYQLKAQVLYRIKINLTTRTLFNRKSDYHIDGCDSAKTAILYLNTNNGWTRFKKGGKVKSVENRMVIFDSNQEHSGVTCTNEQRRVVVNFNYDV